MCSSCIVHWGMHVSAHTIISIQYASMKMINFMNTQIIWVHFHDLSERIFSSYLLLLLTISSFLENIVLIITQLINIKAICYGSTKLNISLYRILYTCMDHNITRNAQHFKSDMLIASLIA